MSRMYGRSLMVGILTVLAGAALASAVTLTAVQFPERRDVSLDFVRTAAAPRAVLKADVEYREGQARIDLKFSGMKPAVLLGGDVTSYVVWAVTREGAATNLGELWVRDRSDSVELSTGLKEFALLVTAESYPLVDRPSGLVMFYSQGPDAAAVKRVEFPFEDLGPEPAHAVSSLVDASATDETPPDLLQARKAYELADREGGADYAAELMNEAKVTLAQATNLATSSSHRKEMVDFSRRTVALASEAIRTTERKKEAERLEALIAARRAEMEALETQAAEAEQKAAAAQQRAAALEEDMAQTRAEMAELRQEKDSVAKEMAAMAVEKSSLETLTAELRTERSTLEAEKAQLQQEKQALGDRLAGALSQVASTESTARGFIVNLPDILFDVNEATLKPDARVTLAKLAGILLIMPELNLRIEGHTDSTGGAAYNLRLSQRRADAVLDLLAEQGVASSRMVSVGYGLDRPIADNDTREGRAKNRRVEIVIAQGKVQEAPAN